MQIQTSAQISIDAPIEQVFDCSIDCQNLPKFFTGYRAISAILNAATTDGLPLHEGSTRIVQNSDGSEIEEAIVALQRPTLHAHKLLRGFKPPVSWLVHSAWGQWSYQAIASRTQINWQFEFEMQHLLAYVIFWAMVKHPFQTAQSICLANLKRTIEHSDWDSLMRITILTTGSRGDIQPFIALGQGLKQAGYQVKLATHDTFQEMAQQYGLEFAAIAGDVQAMLASEAGQNMLKSQNPILLIRQYAQMVQPLVAQAIADSWAACQDSDAIIFTATAVWGYDIAEALGIPCFFASLMPQRSNPDFPYPSLPPTLHLGRTFNRPSYSLLMEGFGLVFRQPLNEFRRSQLHLPPIPFGTIYRRLDRLPTPALYGYSHSVVPIPTNWGDRIQVTGYWFLDQASDWQPSQALLDFLAAGSPPVYIGFGSMSGENAAQLTQVILDALQQTGQRGILLTGWGGIAQTELPNDVFLLHSVPHDWLFPRMAAIVHHGGAGTTAAALRAGVPSVVVPFFGDQPFWGDRVMKLGTSPSPIPKAELTVDRLAAAITTAVTNPVMQQQAKKIGAKIRVEDGVKQAIEVVERYLAHSKHRLVQYA